MTRIVEQHRPIAALVPKGQRALYLDYAFTTNVGDQLIVLGALEFFRSSGIDVKLSRNLHNVEAPGRLPVSPGDVLMFHGGGNFGDIYPHFQNFREETIERYPDNRVVIMPQTVHFSDREKLARSAERLNKHPDITIFLRDHISLATLKPFFGERVQLAPDMAHQLWPGMLTTVGAQNAVHTDEPLFLIRTDVEKVKAPGALDAHRDKFTDWDERTTLSFKIRRKLIRLQYGLAQKGVRLYDLDAAYFSLLQSEVVKTAASLDRYSPWFTSRMHGAILGLLLGKPVFALDNSYGKLSSYFDAWAEWIDPIVLVRNEDEMKAALAFAADAPGKDEATLWAEYRALAASRP